MLYDPKWEVPAPVVVEEDWRKVVRLAAQHLRQYGWIQRWLGSTEYGFCTVGAVLSAACELEGIDYNKARTHVARDNSPYMIAIGKIESHISHNGNCPHSIPGWNDSEYQTKENVIEMLETIAASPEKTNAV